MLLFQYRSDDVTMTYISMSSPPAADDITLMTQFGMDRLAKVAHMLTHWEGPVSAVLYLDKADIQKFHTIWLSHPVLSRRGNVDVHLVTANGVRQSYD